MICNISLHLSSSSLLPVDHRFANLPAEEKTWLLTLAAVFIAPLAPSWTPQGFCLEADLLHASRKHNDNLQRELARACEGFGSGGAPFSSYFTL